MAENYKHLYEQMKKIVAMYQDEIVPGMRKEIEDLEKNQIKVRCKDCQQYDYIAYDYGLCRKSKLLMKNDDFCSCGERKDNG